jgi:hypothetical protein
MIVRIVVGIVTAALLSGCGSAVRFVRMDETKYPAKSKNAAVETFPQETMTPHVVIGTLSTEKTLHASFGEHSVYDETVDVLKSYARQIGADALIYVSPRHVGEGMGGKVRIDATAVRYLQQSETISSADPEKKDTP